MRIKALRVSVYSIAHFAVDFGCAFLMFRVVSSSAQFALCLLLYNFFAFAMQMPLGLIADRLNKNAAFAALGCLLIALCYGLGAAPLIAAIAAGLGNGMFHVGAGLDVLNHSGNRAGPLGVFVSPGAFGIYFGTLLGKQGGVASVLVLLLLLAAAAAMLLARYLPKSVHYPDNAPLSLQAQNGGTPLVLLCLFLVVVLRSYLGMTLAFPWKGEGSWALILTCAVVLGKALGGYLADALGADRAALFSLAPCALLFLFSDAPVAGAAAVLLFNMTMPITLWALARMLPGAKGFAFGALTFALFLGFLPVYLGTPPLFGAGWGYALAAAASLALLYPTLRRIRA